MIFDSNALMTSVMVCMAAVVLDHWLGEPRRWHPLVGFGRLVSCVESRLNPQPDVPAKSIGRGVLGVVLLTLPLLGLAVASVCFLEGWLLIAVESLVLYLALSLRGLAEHGLAVAKALGDGGLDTAEEGTADLNEARRQVGRIVSRKADALDESGVANAATESMLENGADAVFASLFWYLVAGLPGVLLHRLINTLDAMWGYRSPRFLYFGRFAARFDDMLNWVPARLTAITYALLGNTRVALQCWRRQSSSWDSPNAGPVMAAGAGALGVTLGGPAPYPDGIHNRPSLGEGPLPDAGTIRASIRLVERCVWLWLGVLSIAAVAVWLLSAGGR